MVKSSFSEPKNQRQLNILRPIYLKKRFVGLICANKLEGLGVFFTAATQLIWASFISTKK